MDAARYEERVIDSVHEGHLFDALMGFGFGFCKNSGCFKQEIKHPFFSFFF